MNSWQGKDWKVKILFSRAGIATQILIQTLNGDLLVDIGDGTIRDLSEFNYDFKKLKAIALTHGHFDHIGGLWTLLGFLRMIGRTKDLLIITPTSRVEIDKMVNGFLSVYSDTMPFRISMKGLSDRENMIIDGMNVQAFSVIHRGSTTVAGIGKRLPASGYSISYNKQRIVISGDTGKCQSLINFVKNADLAILEATLKLKNQAKSQVHLSVEEAIEIGKTAKEFVLIHQTH